MPRILISGSAGKMDNYIRAVEAQGGTADARYAPWVNAAAYDGLILGGGGDITPALFGAADSGLNREIDPLRERSDLAVIRAFIAQHKPILGICRGMQMLNAALGGTIEQDLGQRNEIHSGTAAGDRFHLVTAKKGTLFYKLYGPEFTVNSYHHQAVLVPAEGFCITCHAPDGTPEGMEHESLPVLATQWHPERLAEGAELMRYFIRLCS